ncbi:DUF6455 family protein [Litorisediminicola beolgyonensis]|uniref:DUF6455 family protein n=1 Tax=Litorisediminicola beolgyonensis TaxID=1173614 RepID=A0ABW3ZFZ0_9RHOB
MVSRTVLKQHAYLVDRMAGALEIDLEEEAMRGSVSIGEIEDAVLACTGCACPGACAAWLDESDSPRAAPPDFCRNGSLFGRLGKATG